MGPQAQLVWDGLELRTPTMLRIVNELSEAAWRWWPPNGSNSVAWLVWHIAEVEDNWVRDRIYDMTKRLPFGMSVRETPADQYPSKSELLAYFREVRGLTHERLDQFAETDFGQELHDEHFGQISARQLWSLVVTSCAWHSGQIALTCRLIPQDLK
jgi:uncharacterized damage-inducible protein DinB